MKQYKWFSAHSILIILSIFLAAIFIIIAGLVLMPDVFYDQWIWKYYWGPIVADAAGHPVTWNGVTANEGYTLISEITYGIILIISLYGIYKLLKKLKITVDWKFCLALMPYILFGPVTRVLEDTGYFQEPFVYWFISPLIYLQIAAYALFFLILGYYIEKIFKKSALTVNTILFSGGLLLLLPSLYLISRWIGGEQWSTSTGVRFDVFILIIALVTVIVMVVYLVSWKYKKSEKFAVYTNPLNLSMIAGHMIDGLTSYVSIYDPLQMGLPFYIEKHPASNILMEVWPPLFPIVKFVLIIVVIYIFDILYKKELQQYKTMVNLLKIGILILGFSPGIRDLLRVTMGV